MSISENDVLSPRLHIWEGIELDNGIEIYSLMLRSRFFEEKVRDLFASGEMYGTTHLNIGQEASHTGLCLALEKEDWIVPTHRCHGFNVARGSDLSAMFSELFGSRYGLCKGIGGSMHMSDRTTYNFGSSAVVGSGVALAAGLAFALHRQNSRNIAVAIFGDGATSRGVVHECMNLASVWSLPLMFYCENNHYGMSASSDRMISTSDIASRAAGYAMKAFKADGNDFDDVYSVVKKARAWMTSHSEPVFVEVSTYRMCGHSKSDKCVYRSSEEENEWRAKDPIVRYEAKLALSKTHCRQIRTQIMEEVEKACEEARAGRDSTLTPDELKSYVLAPHRPCEIRKSGLHSTTYRLAIREALDEILTEDERATLIGEDVGLYGGCFAVTAGLSEKHSESVIETPVSEEAFTGLAAGAAALGEHPVVEIMYGDFSTLASDAIINHAAKLRYMSAGQFNCPLVLRTPMGSGTGHGSQHTQSLEAMFLNVPGLKIVCPSDPFTAKALLKEAVRDPNPVLFFEHKALYDTIGECGDALSSFPIGKAQLLSEGSDITLISYSRATLTCRKALSQSGRSVDHIDLATIKPVDIQTIKESVLKTGRVIIVQDTPLAGSVGASVSAMITGDSEMFAALKKEILIISSMDYPIPFSRTLERAISPTTETVTRALESF